MRKLMAVAVLVVGSTLSMTLPADAANQSKMLYTCKNLASKEYGTQQKNVQVKYEGQRSDGTHAVNGTYETSTMINTFQCSFNRADTVVVNFVKNTPYSKVDEGAL
ncbi:hypothetical protein IQE94_03385 [Synechocystis sp. PCC 7339]|uniref:hypothetical protein n=1 Tax=Synechocystis sp. PCC 7339 TaxID=2782213 RepID=UPI001CBAE388|nr:hypothetical protein [Synechocystis sp. PCC 7339]UAJ73376.1 hypothetical protein IQE94_03385 [Synechocystis sp. PCC 7339]